MPFVSEAQRKWMYASKPEMAKEWQAHTPKGKSLPEHVKKAMVAEMMKRAASLDDAREWIGQHPEALALGLGGLGAGGVVARRLLQKAAPATTASAKRLREIASKHGLGFAYEGGKDPSLLTRLWARIRSGGLSPIYVDEAGRPLSKKMFKGVSVGLPEGAGAAELQWGGRSRVTPALKELGEGGKVKEISKGLGLSHLFEEGQGIGALMRKYKIEPLATGATRSQKIQHLRQIQKAMKSEYGKFVVKPHGLTASSGAFPTHKRDFGKLFSDYKNRLEPKMQKFRQYMKEHPQKFQEWDPEVYVARKFRDDPAYAATALEPMMKDPERTLGQHMMNLVRNPLTKKPYEYRVHMIGGEIDPSLAYNRFAPVREAAGRLPIVGGLFRAGPGGSSREAAEWAAKNVPKNLAKKYHKGTYGLDVIRVKNPDGSLGYKLVELNPSTVEAGGSGFLEPGLNPLSSQDIYKHVFGKDAPLTTGLKALGAGGVLGGAAYGGSKLIGKKPDLGPAPPAPDVSVPDVGL
jgi:hypothetical protein